MDPIDKFENEVLNLNPSDDDFVLMADDLIGSVPAEGHEFLIPGIFRFFEKYALEHCGGPGAFVHLVENYYPHYKKELIASLNKSPSQPAILMVNRILNSKLTQLERKEYIGVLTKIRDNASVHEELRREAEGYIDYQSKNGS